MADNEVKIIVRGENKSKAPVTDAQKDVEKLSKTVEKIPDKKTVNVACKDDASGKLDKIEAKKVADKDVKVKADDQATAEIDKVSAKKPAAVKVPVKMDDSDVGNVTGKMKEAGKAGAGAFIGGFSGALAGGDLMGAVTGAFSDAIGKLGETQAMANNMQNAMGISPEAAKKYGERINQMFWAGVGESKEQISDAFGTLSSDVKGWSSLTVDAQDKIVKGAVGIGKAFKVDIQEPLRAASAMVSSKFVPSYQDAFDLITTGYQTLGSRGDDALDTLTEYSGYFQKLGVTGPQALGLISQGLQAGARDTDYIADAFKEFGIRIVSNTQPVKDALKDLGLNAKKIPQEIEAGGPRAEAALGKVIDALKKMKDPIKRDELGVELFGTQWEDTMRNIIHAIDPAAAKLTEFAGATERLVTQNGTMTEAMGRDWDEFTTNLGEDLAGAAVIASNAKDGMTGFFNVFGESEKSTTEMYNLGVSIDGTNLGIQRLADTMGGYASPKFAEMVQKMSDSELAGYGVTRSLDAVGNTVLRLPNGKTITIDTNSGKVISDVSGIKRVVDSLPTAKFFTYYMDTVVRGPGPGTANLPMPFRAAGGPAAASGGARGRATLVNERGPELGRSPSGVIRDLETGTTVIPAGQSAAIMSGAGPTGGGAMQLVVDFTGVEGMFGRAFETWFRTSVRIGGQAGSVQGTYGGRR